MRFESSEASARSLPRVALLSDCEVAPGKEHPHIWKTRSLRVGRPFRAASWFVDSIDNGLEGAVFPKYAEYLLARSRSLSCISD